MIAVKFLKDYEPYEPGHVVDLPDELANKLIEEGACRVYAPGSIFPLHASVSTDQPEEEATER